MVCTRRRLVVVAMLGLAAVGYSQSVLAQENRIYRSQTLRSQSGGPNNDGWGQKNDNGKQGGGPSWQQDVTKGIIELGTEMFKNAPPPRDQRERRGRHQDDEDDDSDGGQYYYPQYQQAPSVQPTPQLVQPKPNVLPAPARAPSKAPITVEPAKNTAFKSFGLTPAEIQAFNAQIDQKNKKSVDEVVPFLPDKKLTGDAIKALPLPPGGRDKDQVSRIEDAVRNGDVGGLQNLLNAADKASPAGAELLKQANVFAAFNAMKRKVADGTLTPADLGRLRTELLPYLPNNAARVKVGDSLFDLAVNAKLKDLLNSAVPGSGTIPLGNVPIVSVGNLPLGTLITLGNGSVMIGTGSNSSSVSIGVGSVAQAVGWQVAAGPPLPESRIDVVTGGTILINTGDADVNYVLNDRQFTMGPKYTQLLPAETTWTVTFDRGGGGGEAQYQLHEGTYNFTPTEKGWDLYAVTACTCTLDNSRSATEFHYVLNNTAYTLAAHEKREHSEKYPLVIRFDNGSGKVRQKKLDAGVSCVAVTADNAIDLFTAEALTASSPVAGAPTPSSSPTEPAPAGARPAVSLFGNLVVPVVPSGSFGNLSSAEAFFAQPGLGDAAKGSAPER